MSDKRRSATSYCETGAAHLREGKTEEAIGDFKAGLAVASSSYEKGVLLYNLATCHARRGDIDLTVTTLRDAFKSYPAVRRSIKSEAAFASLANDVAFRALATEMEESRMPIGVAILGWLGIVVGILVGASLLTVARDPSLRMSFVSPSVRVLTGVLYPLVLGYGLLKRREWAITLYQFVYPAVLLIGLVAVLFRTVGHQDLYQPRSDWMPIVRYIGMAIPKLAAWGAIVYYLTRPRVLRCFR